MTSDQQQEILDAVQHQTIAILVAGAFIFLAVITVLVAWLIEYRSDQDHEDRDDLPEWWRCPWCNGDIRWGGIEAHMAEWHASIKVGR